MVLVKYRSAFIVHFAQCFVKHGPAFALILAQKLTFGGLTRCPICDRLDKISCRETTDESYAQFLFASYHRISGYCNGNDHALQVRNVIDGRKSLRFS
jgi:hypothetical protein